jgi:hypothetical protein
LFGAGVRTQIQGIKRFTDTIGLGESPQIIDQSLALLRETQFRKIQETRWIAEGELCAFAGQAKRNEGGGDFRRRMESVARNFKDEFRASVKLRDHGKVAVIAGARLSREAKRDFRLNDDVNFVDEVREGEQVMKNRRGDVVGKIAVDADAAAAGDGGEVRFEDIAGNDGEIREFLRELAKAGDELRVDFDGVDGSADGEEVLGHFTVAGADFDPAMSIVPRERDGGMRRNANGARDLLAPMEIGEEVLAEALACHWGSSVTKPRRYKMRLGPGFRATGDQK